MFQQQSRKCSWRIAIGLWQRKTLQLTWHNQSKSLLWEPINQSRHSASQQKGSYVGEHVKDLTARRPTILFPRVLIIWGTFPLYLKYPFWKFLAWHLWCQQTIQFRLLRKRRSFFACHKNRVTFVAFYFQSETKTNIHHEGHRFLSCSLFRHIGSQANWKLHRLESTRWWRNRTTRWWPCHATLQDRSYSIRCWSRKQVHCLPNWRIKHPGKLNRRELDWELFAFVFFNIWILHLRICAAVVYFFSSPTSSPLICSKHKPWWPPSHAPCMVWEQLDSVIWRCSLPSPLEPCYLRWTPQDSASAPSKTTRSKPLLPLPWHSLPSWTKYLHEQHTLSFFQIWYAPTSVCFRKETFSCIPSSTMKGSGRFVLPSVKRRIMLSLSTHK